MKDGQLETKELSIPGSIQGLDNVISGLVESFEQLHARIEPILSSPDPGKETSCDRGEGDCNLAEKLNQLTDRAQSLRNLIEATSKRVEL